MPSPTPWPPSSPAEPPQSEASEQSPPAQLEGRPTQLDAALPLPLERLRELCGGEVCAYVYDLDGLRAHVRSLVERIPRGVELFYAVKANSQEPVLRAIAPYVQGFEVASIGELRKVSEVAPHKPIIFGGPGKTDAEIEEALRRSVHLLHVESLHELRRAAHVAARVGGVLRILLRVNLRDGLPEATLRMAGTTQFGLDETLVPDAIAEAVASPHLELVGLHFHSVSNQRDAAAHARLVALYVERAHAWFEAHGIPLRVVNAGGGIGVSYEDPAWRFDWSDLLSSIENKYLVEWTRNSVLRLIFECGRFLSAYCGVYAVEVLDVKRNHGTWWAVVRGGSHHFRLPSSWHHSHPFVVVPCDDWPYPFARPGIENATVNVVGQLCTPKDRLATYTHVDRLRANDVLLFQMAGAYGWEISHDRFLSHPPPARIYVDGETITLR